MTTKKNKNNAPKELAALKAKLEAGGFAASYDALAERLKLKLASTSVDKNPNAPEWDADHWKVTLARGKKKVTTYYSKTRAFEGEPPTMEEVLCCLTIDARILEKSTSYDAWLAEYTWTDSPHAKRVYADAQRVSSGLKGIFNPDEFKALLALDAVEEKKS